MSINVHVSGNPVNIRRGKMVTVDSNSAKDEFGRRRLMRLEQVRQQSKDIAGDVRNKVRQEKIKQMRKIEEEGKEKLKDWKNRKLLELQSQYNGALKELGTAHREAENVVDDLENYEKQKLLNKKLSVERGKEAATKLQIEKNEENLRKSIPLQYKKVARDIENVRANLVSNMSNAKGICKKIKRKPQANINISISSTSDAESSSVAEVENMSPINVETSSNESLRDPDYPREPLKENFGKLKEFYNLYVLVVSKAYFILMI